MRSKFITEISAFVIGCSALLILVNCDGSTTSSNVNQNKQNVQTNLQKEDSANSKNSNQSNSTSSKKVSPENKTVANLSRENVQAVQPSDDNLSSSDGDIISNPEAVNQFIHNLIKEQNMIKVERDYYGRIIEIKGKVNGVGKIGGDSFVDVNSNPEIKLRINEYFEKPVHFTCYFDKAEEQRLADLKVGDAIVVRGKVVLFIDKTAAYDIFLGALNFH